jgi:hypothetical protein
MTPVAGSIFLNDAKGVDTTTGAGVASKNPDRQTDGGTQPPSDLSIGRPAPPGRGAFLCLWG